MPTLAVFHATGQQGSSVLNDVLDDAKLSKTWKLRALTRDISSQKSKALSARGVEVVEADSTSSLSIEKALKGADAVFAVTVPDFTPNAVAVEYARAKLIADATVAAGARWIIFSTLSNVSELSGGKYTKVYPYDAKAKAEEYIRSLPIKSAFFCGAPFMQNFASQPFLAPVKEAREDGEERWVWRRNNSPKARYPLIDGTGDVGKFVTPVLAEPDKYEGKTFYGAERIYTLEEVSSIMSKTTGKNVVYEQMSDDAFHADLLKKTGSELIADIFVDAFKFYEEYGAFGPGTDEKIDWSVKQARGKLTSLEAFFEKNPLPLNDGEGSGKGILDQY